MTLPSASGGETPILQKGVNEEARRRKANRRPVVFEGTIDQCESKQHFYLICKILGSTVLYLVPSGDKQQREAAF